MKVIPGYPDYLIGICGCIYSKKTHKYLKWHREGRGYASIKLHKNGLSKKFKIHRLVMLTYVGYSNLAVNHKDFNRLNNCLDNLEYVTSAENMKHANSRKAPPVGSDKFNHILNYLHNIRDLNLPR